MIPVKAVPEPADFEAACRQPGIRWQRANPNAKRPAPLWTKFNSELAKGFAQRCGYCALWDPTGGTVDHFLSIKARPDLAYEWQNLRFANQAMNASKKNADAAVLDPYEVGEDWFEIILPSMQMRLTANVPAALKAKAQYTLHRLGLGDGERVVRARRKWYALYLEGKLTLAGLQECAPQIAKAVQASRPPKVMKRRKK